LIYVITKNKNVFSIISYIHRIKGSAINWRLSIDKHKIVFHSVFTIEKNKTSQLRPKLECRRRIQSRATLGERWHAAGLDKLIPIDVLEETQNE
jgi:hypothetical protein